MRWLTLLLLLPFAAHAQDVAIGLGVPIVSIDPHYLDSAPNKGVVSNIFDGLTDVDAVSNVIPSLAIAWEHADDQDWIFHLRNGVQFQDGAAFTAADVAASLNRVNALARAPVPFTTYTRGIDRVDIIDPQTVRLHTVTINPLLPVYLAQVKIIERAQQAAETAAFNSGRAAIGTGPYRMAGYTPGQQLVLVRNDRYWGVKPHWGQVTLRVISVASARVAALLSGDVQAIDTVPTNDVPRLRANPAVAVSDITSLRMIYIALDLGRVQTPFVKAADGADLPQNPLRDRRVRQALSIAINRDAIVKQIMDDEAQATGQLLPPGSISYVPDLPPPPYDPAGAKRLLTEAGFPDGLIVTLHGPNDRYVNDSHILQAVGQMWQRVGIRTTVEALPWANYAGQVNRQAFSLTLGGVGNPTADDSIGLSVLLDGFDPTKGLGALNSGRYDNPEVDRLSAQAMATGDDALRNQLLAQATKIAFEDVAVIPLHIQKNIWATRAGLGYAARRDEQTRAADLQAQ